MDNLENSLNKLLPETETEMTTQDLQSNNNRPSDLDREISSKCDRYADLSDEMQMSVLFTDQALNIALDLLCHFVDNREVWLNQIADKAAEKLSGLLMEEVEERIALLDTNPIINKPKN